MLLSLDVDLCGFALVLGFCSFVRFGCGFVITGLTAVTFSTATWFLSHLAWQKALYELYVFPSNLNVHTGELFSDGLPSSDNGA